MMSLFLIAALGLARDQTFLKLGEVTSLKESAAPSGQAKDGQTYQDLVEKVETTMDNLGHIHEKTERLSDLEVLKKEKSRKALRNPVVAWKKGGLKGGNLFLKTVTEYSVNEDKLKGDIENITAELAKLFGKMKTTGELAGTSRSLFDRYLAQVKKLESDVKVLQGELDKRTDELSRKETQHEETTSSVKSSQQETEEHNAQLREQIRELQNKLESQPAGSGAQDDLPFEGESFADLTRQQAINEGAMEALREAQVLITEDQKDEIEALRNRNNELSEEYNEKQKEIELKVAKRDAEIESLQRTLRESNLEALARSMQTGSSQHKVEAVTSKELNDDDCHKQLESLKKELEEARKGNNLAGELGQHLLQQKTQLEEENQKLHNESSQQKNELTELRINISKKKNELQASKGELGVHELEEDRLRVQAADLKKKLNAHQLEMDKHIEDKHKMEDEMHEMRKNLDAAKTADEGYETDSGRSSLNSSMMNSQY